MTFEEQLPSQCPPPDATDQNLDHVCRFLTFDQGDPKNFYSHNKLGKPLNASSQCSGCSISLFTKDAVPNVLAAKKMGFFRKCKIAVLTVPQGVGVSLEGSDGHIDFWPFQGNRLPSCTARVVDSADEL